MKAIVYSLLLLCSAVFSLPAADEITADTVVATVNGREVTAGQIEDVLSGAPDALRQSMQGSLRNFLRQYALTTVLVGMAEEDGLDEVAPYRQQLEWNRMQVLWQAAVQERSQELTAEVANANELENAMRTWMDEVQQQSAPKDLNEEYFSTPLQEVADVDPGTVIATLNSGPLTVGEIREVLIGASSQRQQAFRTQAREFLNQYAMMLELVNIAEEKHLDEKSPYKNQIDWARSQVLMQAKVNAYNGSISIDTAAQQEYYQANLERYTEAEVKVLYLSFASSEGQTRADGTPVPTEDEARNAIASLRQQIEEGADFVELVHEYSEDASSRDKDGDFGVIRQTDAIPEAIKEAIFATEAGEVTQPIRQPNGFYLFKVERIGTPAPKDVLQQLMRDAKAAKFQEWFDSVRNSIEITYERPDYFDAN